jgi:protocadherin Fat 1/2/3
VVVVVTVLGASLNENLRFSLLNPTDMFTIGATSGAVRTTGKRFDREVQNKHELVVEAKSADDDHRRSRPRVAHAIVDVDVLDINDNAPMFVNRPYHAVMSKDAERDSTIVQVMAVDADEGTNGDIYYQLVKGNGELFRVGRKSGQITLRQSLESYNKEYRLTVAAYDGGTPPFSAEVAVQIKVIDKSVPVFTRQLYKAGVREDVEAYTPVTSVEAESPSNKLIYTIEAGNEEEQFTIDYNTGAVSVNGGAGLDYETKPHHQLTVRATDGVSGGYAEAVLLVGVEDVNDCRPRFKNDSYEASVSESMPFGTGLLSVSATDADSGANGEVEFTIFRDGRSNASDFFSIDPASGELSLKRRLDHERARDHRFSIVAADKGSRQLSATAAIHINVLDANDNSPDFEEAEYDFRLSDRSERGQFVGRVRAVDPDETDNARLRYAIIGGNQHQVFSMDEASGVVSLVNLNNFDQVSLYTLNVSVTDGVFSSSSRVRISLVSANSFAPEFAHGGVFETAVAENGPEGLLVARVIATDGDRNDRVAYSIPSEELSQHFKIDSDSGEVWALKSYDREARETYEIPVTATDLGGRNGFATLKVKITDVNDNRPRFALKEYRANVRANLTAGSPVLAVHASDADEGRNAALRYSIYENETSEVGKLLEIDQRTGQINLKKSGLGLENQIYQFFVRAQVISSMVIYSLFHC